MTLPNLLQGLELKGVDSLDSRELGRGAYGRVYSVKYCGMICAAKEIHSILIEGVGEVEMNRVVESFLRECSQCSKLRHPTSFNFWEFITQWRTARIGCSYR